MATEIKIEFSDEENRKYCGKVIGGRVSLIPCREDPNVSMFEASIKLQSWASFTIKGDVGVFVSVKSGARTIRTLRVGTKELVITRGENGHSLRCKTSNLDLRRFFGSVHEHSA